MLNSFGLFSLAGISISSQSCHIGMAICLPSCIQIREGDIKLGHACCQPSDVPCYATPAVGDIPSSHMALSLPMGTSPAKILKSCSSDTPRLSHPPFAAPPPAPQSPYPLPNVRTPLTSQMSRPARYLPAHEPTSQNIPPCGVSPQNTPRPVAQLLFVSLTPHTISPGSASPTLSSLASI